MTNNSASTQGGPNANTTIQHMYQMGLRCTQNICGIVTTPIEFGLRPFFGTRYFDPIQMLFTWLLMVVLPLAGMATNRLPLGAGGASSTGAIGLGMLSILFFASQAIHGPRLWRRMMDMEREQHSEFEGDALPFFARLPFGDSFWLVRIFWEPAFVAALGIALHVIRILDRPAMLYLIAAAALLSVKNFLFWYQSWLHLRILMDAKFAGPLVVKAASGKATEKELAQVHMAGFPKGVPVEIRTAAIAEMAPRTLALPPEIAQLISPLEADAPHAA
jgi:hypothetical protein